MKKIIFLLFFAFAVLTLQSILSTSAQAHWCRPPGSCGTSCCSEKVSGCQEACGCVSDTETEATINHITSEFQRHRAWMVETFFKGRLLPAMQNMTTQMNSIALLQVQVIGSFFDAKHQLETQRLFQTLTAQAHKDYHPSDGLCRIGTMSRSLAASNAQTRLNEYALSEFMTNRSVMGQDSTAHKAAVSDQPTRLITFLENHCSPADNNQNLNLLCRNGSTDPVNANLDVDYTRLIDAPKTIDMNFLDGGAATEDEKSVLALSQNLFSPNVFPFVSKNNFVDSAGKPLEDAAAQTYMDVRSFLAKQSVAMHSFASIAGLKAKGEEGAQPFIYALLKEMGGSAMTATQIENEIGEAPSYNAQMEILTKKLYQQPEFYSDLYDKPANVMRKQVAIQAANLMQKRDLYDSYLRTEMSLAVMLETLLMKQQSELTNEVRTLR